MRGKFERLNKEYSEIVVLNAEKEDEAGMIESKMEEMVGQLEKMREMA